MNSFCFSNVRYEAALFSSLKAFWPQESKITIQSVSRVSFHSLRFPTFWVVFITQVLNGLETKLGDRRLEIIYERTKLNC